MIPAAEPDTSYLVGAGDVALGEHHLTVEGVQRDLTSLAREDERAPRLKRHEAEDGAFSDCGHASDSFQVELCH